MYNNKTFKIKINLNMNLNYNTNNTNNTNTHKQDNTNKIYNIINRYGEFLYNDNFNDIDSKIKNQCIVKFKELYLDGLFIFYGKTNRTNLLDFNFITMKIGEELNNTYIVDKFNKLSTTNSGLQLMLWDILQPDSIELS